MYPVPVPKTMPMPLTLTDPEPPPPGRPAPSPKLSPYNLYEAGVLAGLNRHMSGIMESLGISQPSADLTASALSQVCGRTLRDWGAPSS